MNANHATAMAAMQSRLEAALLKALATPPATLDEQKEQVFRIIEKQFLEHMGGDSWKNHVDFTLKADPARRAIDAKFKALTEYGRLMLVDLRLIPDRPVEITINISGMDGRL